MWETVAKRLIQAPIILLIVSATIFAITRATPGDPIQIMLGSQTSPDAVAALRTQFRLDEPVYMQYFYWLGDLFRGDFGKSIRLNVPVLDLLAERLPISLMLASGALILAFLVSIPLGILAALKRNTWIDYLATGYTLLGFAVPNFALAIILIYVFSIQLGWFPITGIGSGAFASGSAWDMIRPFVLPAVALGTLQTAVFTRLFAFKYDRCAFSGLYSHGSCKRTSAYNDPCRARFEKCHDTVCHHGRYPVRVSARRPGDDRVHLCDSWNRVSNLSRGRESRFSDRSRFRTYHCDLFSSREHYRRYLVFCD